MPEAGPLDDVTGVTTSDAEDERSAMAFFASMGIASDALPERKGSLLFANDNVKRSEAGWPGKEVLKSGWRGGGKDEETAVGGMPGSGWLQWPGEGDERWGRGKDEEMAVGWPVGRGGGRSIDAIVTKCFDLSASTEITQHKGLAKLCAFLVKACDRKCPSPQCERLSESPSAPPMMPPAPPPSLPPSAPPSSPTAE